MPRVPGYSMEFAVTQPGSLQSRAEQRASVSGAQLAQVGWGGGHITECGDKEVALAAGSHRVQEGKPSTGEGRKL